MSMVSARRFAREIALQGIYQRLLSGNEATSIEAQFIDNKNFNRADQAFCAGLFRDVVAHQAELDELLAPHTHRALTEISPVEHSILLLACHEMKNHPETPYRVIINEAIELAKRYGGTTGHRFINGVLDKLATHLRDVELNMPAQEK